MKLLKEIKKHFSRVQVDANINYNKILIPTELLKTKKTLKQKKKSYLEIHIARDKNGTYRDLCVLEPSPAKSYTHINKIDYFSGKLLKKPHFRLEETKRLYEVLKEFFTPNSIKFIEGL